MALLAPRLSGSACMAPRRTERPCVVVRSAQVQTPAPATSTASVISLDSGEYDEFIAANEIVLVDYYTE